MPMWTDSLTAKNPIPVAQRHEMDQWIISALNTLIEKVTVFMDDYEPTQAGRAVEHFVDEHLSNWYVRLSRRRFWKGEYNEDKISAYQTLYECLETLSLLIAPVSPFFADWLFQNLNRTSGKHQAVSVHLMDFPEKHQEYIQEDLEQRMQSAQDISSLILSIRKKENIRVRQPLSKVLIPVLNEQVKQQVEKVKDIILSEVNIKEIEYLEPDNIFMNKKIKPNFKTLGKKVGGLMKDLAAMISNFSQEQINRIEQEGGITCEINGQQVSIVPEDVEITAGDIPGWSVASKGSLTAALDITITEDLEEEGNARELINRLQKIRKEQDLELTDRIEIYLKNAESMSTTVQKYDQYIKAETLADMISFSNNGNDLEWEEVEINNQNIQIHIKKSK